MSTIERITKAAHLIDMNDIIREGNPTLRAVAEAVSYTHLTLPTTPYV